MSAVIPPAVSQTTHPLLAAKEKRAAYRDYEQDGIDRVRSFYRNNHTHQTFDFVQAKKAKWLQFNKRDMTPWKAWLF